VAVVATVRGRTHGRGFFWLRGGLSQKRPNKSRTMEKQTSFNDPAAARAGP
jgi:hypothetical protein